MKRTIFQKMKNKNWLKWFLLFKAIKWAISLAFFFGLFSCDSFQGNEAIVSQDKTIFIPSGSDFNEMLDSVSPYLTDREKFISYAKRKDLDKYVKSGRYDIKAGMTTKELVGKMRRGEQDQQKLTIKNHFTIYEMAGKIAKQIEPDSAEIVKAILKYNYGETGMDDEKAKKYYIPNTYFVWWDISPEEFVEKMHNEYKRLWNAERKGKAVKMGMSEQEVTTLASIVQLEASKGTEEQKKVAKAYLNRLEKGMKLQADPTAVYGYNKENGFNTVYRVYNYHLRYPSPYNTYLKTGLPPSPICLPNSSAIDAVLNPAQHPHVYFCAKADNSQTHHFTSSYAEHEKNARAYRQWLNQRGVK